jgi:hypothetical protein
MAVLSGPLAATFWAMARLIPRSSQIKSGEGHDERSAGESVFRTGDVETRDHLLVRLGVMLTSGTRNLLTHSTRSRLSTTSPIRQAEVRQVEI